MDRRVIITIHSFLFAVFIHLPVWSSLVWVHTINPGNRAGMGGVTCRSSPRSHHPCGCCGLYARLVRPDSTKWMFFSITTSRVTRPFALPVDFTSLEWSGDNVHHFLHVYANNVRSGVSTRAGTPAQRLPRRPIRPHSRMMNGVWMLLWKIYGYYFVPRLMVLFHDEC